MNSESALERLHPRQTPLRWALARLGFYAYIGVSMTTVIGGFLTAPLMSWLFFGDWRFWRHWSVGAKLLPHGFHLVRMMSRDRRGFMLSVPLTSPPRSVPDRRATQLRTDWPHHLSCGECNNCCYQGGRACPLLDTSVGLCRGHDSFYWRYFNCGRFPSTQPEVDYYDCRKWDVPLSDLEAGRGDPLPLPASCNTRAG